MSAIEQAEASLKAGDPTQALTFLQDAVRAKPAEAKLRTFLFQLLAVLGQWERALNQLNVASELDAGALAMAQTYREAIRCELLRSKVFAGGTAPMVFGHPEQWLALLIESLLLHGRGESAGAKRLRAQAFDEAPATAGTLNGEPFEWIADADSRLGPVIEAVINGKYYWVPFNRLASLDIEAPADLRDFVWCPAQMHFTNGGEAVALIPTRYVGSERATEGAIQLSRKTAWVEPEPGVFLGAGQRVLATDAGEFALLEVRNLTFSDGAGGG